MSEDIEQESAKRRKLDNGYNSPSDRPASIEREPPLRPVYNEENLAGRLEKLVFAYRVEGRERIPCAELWTVKGFVSDSSTEVSMNNNPLHSLSTPVNCRQDQINMFGRIIPVPRESCLSSEKGDFDYVFSNQSGKGAVATALELELISKMNDAVFKLTGVEDSVNALLKNHYRHKDDSVSPHQDKEQHIKRGLVAAVSVGEQRLIVFSPAIQDKFRTEKGISMTREKKVVIKGLAFITVMCKGQKYLVIEKPYTWTDPTGCLWLMKGNEFQTLLTHAVPKVNFPCKARISFTGRYHLNS